MADNQGRVAASRFPPGLTVACLVCLLLAACSGSRSRCLPGFVALNRPAPEFTVQDRDGQVHRLSDFRGKVVLINFWATWCPPCIEEMPSMESLRKEMDESQLQIMALSVDDSWEPIDTFLEKDSTVSESTRTSRRKSPNSTAPTWFPRPISWTSRESSCAR